jgi:hypothetical protein
MIVPWRCRCSSTGCRAARTEAAGLIGLVTVDHYAAGDGGAFGRDDVHRGAEASHRVMLSSGIDSGWPIGEGELMQHLRQD